MSNPDRDTRTPARAVDVPDTTGVLVPLWKNDEPGTPFINGDVVEVPVGRCVMYLCPAGDAITFNLPLINAGNAGRICGFYELTFASKAFGTINCVPRAAQSVGGHPNGQSVAPQAGIMGPWFQLAQDGVSQWNVPVGLIMGSSFDAFA